MQDDNEYWKHFMLLEISDYSTHLEDLKKEAELYNQNTQRLQYQFLNLQGANQSLRTKLVQTEQSLQQMEMERHKFTQDALIVNNNTANYVISVLQAQIAELTQLAHGQNNQSAPDTTRTDLSSNGHSETTLKHSSYVYV
ncbi:hypothetical protein RFI_33282 [Reticulomyxa filosa]|uniref:Uncharacterized protein n=1 Tax=Reticulomyxa filosa TaxID=46433 RepID=X6LTR1_RETFI|nr:hypothetical protein RFI_33282 [Reticulomyxa filosa]|eukprot:ETO04120.1 hypothetical protein RFI_33282 [Reticulomyxa filosa]